MIKAKEMINDALEEINAKVAGEPLSSEDGESAKRTLNDMMLMWDSLGVSIGYTTVSNMGDTITAPLGAIYGMKKLLAVSLANRFKRPVTQDLMREAKQGWEAILDLAFDIIPMSYPSTLPIGSGNDFGGCSPNKFYPSIDQAILGELSGYIALESNT